jgi:hypothetical protein
MTHEGNVIRRGVLTETRRFSKWKAVGPTDTSNEIYSTWDWNGTILTVDDFK